MSLEINAIPPFIDEKSIYTVDELNNAINLELQESFGIVYVEGEISNLAKPSSGHLYFTLKDNRSQVRCALFRGYRNFIKTKIENGQKILVKAKISIYAPRGDYQLIIEHAYPTGLGALQQAFEQLKKKLSTEGLFNAEYKKTLPKLPGTIYIVTSPTGAAVRDILTTLNRRFPSIPVKILPTLVQGGQAATSITKALELADKLADPYTDIIILTRGGGSLEDLWAFNDEALARAIFKAQTPIVTGIGHEVDFTIADFVADLRAATPTAAAESATPNWRDYLYKITDLEQRLSKTISHIIINLLNIIKNLNHRLIQQHPETKLFNQAQLLDELYVKLTYLWEKQATGLKNKIKLLNHRLEQNSPSVKIKIQQNKLEHYTYNLNTQILNLLKNNQNTLVNMATRLNAVNPLEVLARGYSILKTQDNQVITSSSQVCPGDRINAKLHLGEINLIVQD